MPVSFRGARLDHRSHVYCGIYMRSARLVLRTLTGGVCWRCGGDVEFRKRFLCAKNNKNNKSNVGFDGQSSETTLSIQWINSAFCLT